MKKSILTLALILFLCGTFSTSVRAAHGIYPTRSQIFPQSKPRQTEPAKKGSVLYYGGPVISNAKVYAVFWGASVDATTQKKIGGFYSAVLNSTHMDWLTQYATNLKAVDGRDGTHQTIGRGTFNGEFLITPSHTARDLDDKDIRSELELQIAKGALPKPDANTLYMIHFPAGVNITIEGEKSCVSFCAYHEGFTSKTQGDVFYGVMPDYTTGACSRGCGSAKDPFDTATVISSHELIEAITDPFPTPGSSPAFPQAWNTPKGEEIGDLCSSTSTQLKTQGLTYLLQKEWDNLAGKCAAGPYHSP